jgi:hypothetical protein
VNAFRRLALVTILVASLVAPWLAFLPAAPNASAYGGIEVTMQRPAYAGINETFECVLVISGGPAQDGGNYSYGSTIEGTNTTGSSISPASGPSQASGVFRFNVTMPEVAPQTIKIRVNATSTSSTGTASDTLQRDFEVKVVVPIVLKAVVLNKGPVPVSNATARFYADGTLLSTQVFNISGSGTQNLSYNWTFLKIKNGKHVVTITIDDPNNIVEFTDGNNVISRDIWVGKQSNIAGAVLTGGVVVLAVLVFLMWIQKPMRKPKK